MTKERLEHLATGPGMQEDFVSCFGTLSEHAAVTGNQCDRPMVYVLTSTTDTILKLHDWYDHALEGVVFRCGRNWIERVEWKRFSPSGTYILNEAYIDKLDRHHIDSNGRIAPKFRLPLRYCNQKWLEDERANVRGEAWRESNPPRVIFYPLLLLDSEKFIEVLESEAGDNLGRFKNLSETMMHEVLHLLDCE